MEREPSRSGKMVVIAFVALTIAFAAVVSYGMHALRIPPGAIPSGSAPVSLPSASTPPR